MLLARCQWPQQITVGFTISKITVESALQIPVMPRTCSSGQILSQSYWPTLCCFGIRSWQRSKMRTCYGWTSQPYLSPLCRWYIFRRPSWLLVFLCFRHILTINPRLTLSQQTIFGMNFFDMDQTNNRIVGTPMIWIFFVSAAALTTVTFLLYYWLLRRDGAALQGLTPRIQSRPTWSIEGVRRRFTGSTNSSTELQAYSAWKTGHDDRTLFIDRYMDTGQQTCF